MTIKSRLETAEKAVNAGGLELKPHNFKWIKDGEVIREETLFYSDSLPDMPPWLVKIIGSYHQEADDLLLDGESLNEVQKRIDAEYL